MLAGRQVMLNGVVHLAGYATPTARDWKDMSGIFYGTKEPGRVDAESEGPISETRLWGDVVIIPFADWTIPSD